MPGLKIRSTWVKEGKCFDCGEERGPKGTGTRCQACAQEHSNKQKVRNKAKRARRKKLGRCLECGKKLKEGEVSLCADHRNLKGYFDRNYYSKVTA
jgi:hypothetical protein